MSASPRPPWPGAGRCSRSTSPATCSATRTSRAATTSPNWCTRWPARTAAPARRGACRTAASRPGGPRPPWASTTRTSTASWAWARRSCSEPARSGSSEAREDVIVDLPLRGIRVIDITVVWSGPSACRLMAALGAEVIRVESIDHFPASSRGPVPYPPPEVIGQAKGLAAAYPGKDPGPDPYNRYAPFLITGQGKRSVTMELYTEEGRRAFRQLVQCSDVLVENNSRSISNALRLTWEELGPVNPGLVLVRMAPLGLDGPYADATGYGMHFEALTGIGSLRGHADADPGDAGSTFHMDDVGPQGVVFAVLAALMQRERTGQGQLVEFAQGEYLMQGLGDAFVASSLDGQAFSPDGNRHPAWLQGLYPCRGEDQWIALTVRDDAELAGLTGVLGEPEWAADPRFASVAAGREHQDELDQRLAGGTAGGATRGLVLAPRRARR